MKPDADDLTVFCGSLFLSQEPVYETEKMVYNEKRIEVEMKF